MWAYLSKGNFDITKSISSSHTAKCSEIVIMTVYMCTRCGFARDKKSTLTNHVLKKKRCRPFLEEVEPCCIENPSARITGPNHSISHILNSNNNNRINNINNTININVTCGPNDRTDHTHRENSKMHPQHPASTSFKRKPLSKALRTSVWKSEQRATDSVGMDTVPCACCHERVTIYDYDCGHLVSVANGGATTIDNLRVMCRTCNASMGRTNFDEFRVAFLRTRNGS